MPTEENIFLCAQVESTAQCMHPIPPVGALAIVTAWEGLRWTPEVARRGGLWRTAKSCGSDAPMQASSSKAANAAFRAMVSQKAGSPGRSRISRKAIAQGRPEASAKPVCSGAALLCNNCARDRGCGAHPVFPAPSDFLGGVRFKGKSSGVWRCGMIWRV
jgi:hypothetical protein